MHHAAALPGTQDGISNRWGSRPLQDLERFLQELAFVPVTVSLWFQGNFYPVAKLLGLEVPFQGEEGTLELIPGYEVSYVWGSFDGRSTDYLTLSGAYNDEALRTLLARFDAVMALEHRADLEIVVKSASIPA